MNLGKLFRFIVPKILRGESKETVPQTCSATKEETVSRAIDRMWNV